MIGHDVAFGFAEALRILLVALVALNIGHLGGRVKHYFHAQRALRAAGRRTDADTARAVVTFFAGVLIIQISIGWRVMELYHAPVSPPLVILAVGLLVTLWGMHRMAKHVTPRVISEDGRDVVLRRRSRD